MELNRENIRKLLKLLGSENRANAQVAVSILEGMGLYRTFATDLYIQALEEKDGRRQAFLIRCIDNISPEGFNFQLQNIKGYLETLRLYEDSLTRQIYRVAKGLKLDGQVLLRYVLQSRESWLHQLWTGADANRRRDVLRFQFRQLGEQWVMHLHELNLEHLPGELTEFQTIEVLDLRNNRFTKIPEGLTNLERLRVVDLRGNNIRTLPEDLQPFQNLELLDLRDTPLEISRRSLEIYREHIFLKADLGEDAEAMLLNHIDEQLRVLPCFLEYREGQMALNLASLGLNRVPEGIGQLGEIEILDLRNNRLTTLPRFVADLPRLRVVNVMNNYGIKVHPRIQENLLIKVIGPGTSRWKKNTSNYWDYPEAFTASRASGFRRLLKQGVQANPKGDEPYRPGFEFELPEDML